MAMVGEAGYFENSPNPTCCSLEYASIISQLTRIEEQECKEKNQSLGDVEYFVNSRFNAAQ
jgi:hypothetical protein